MQKKPSSLVYYKNNSGVEHLFGLAFEVCIFEMYAKVDYVKLRALFALSERPKLTNIDLSNTRSLFTFVSELDLHLLFAFYSLINSQHAPSIGQQEHLDDGVVGFMVADWKIEQQQQQEQQQKH
ncbi:hypothetical protein T11_5025 [Trichinella zimbabwensis]|uniref:Uncharacterized protein n=1 Tax=Trichinella zimbabwensis TaxID=268475 RepID=A0A0V1HEH8_9BILA|nr:hypothetical protein T11_5025 [Trichinella zimbabwensis]